MRQITLTDKEISFMYSAMLDFKLSREYSTADEGDVEDLVTKIGDLWLETNK